MRNSGNNQARLLVRERRRGPAVLPRSPRQHAQRFSSSFSSPFFKVPLRKSGFKTKPLLQVSGTFAFFVYCYNQPTDFDTFLEAQKDFVSFSLSLQDSVTCRLNAKREKKKEHVTGLFFLETKNDT